MGKVIGFERIVSETLTEWLGSGSPEDQVDGIKNDLSTVYWAYRRIASGFEEIRQLLMIYWDALQCLGYDLQELGVM